MQYSVGLPTDRVDAPHEFVTGDAVAEMAAAAEAAGFSACYVTDHPAPDDRWLAGGGHHALEPLVALSFAAAATTTLRLHTHVYVAAYRNPFLAAKGIASLDVLSGGRVILGVAAGYLRPEFGALGVDFDERNDLLDDSIALMRRLWTEAGVAVDDGRLRARGVTQVPRPAKCPPIWVGGNSSRAMRRAVELGDGWSPFPNPVTASTAVKTPAITNIDELADRLDQAREHAATVGRTEPLEISFAPFRLGDGAEPYAALGVTWLTVHVDGASTRAEWIERVGEMGRDLVEA